MTTNKWDVNYFALAEDLRTLALSIRTNEEETTGDRDQDFLKAVDTMIGTAYLQGIHNEPLEAVFKWVIPVKE